MSEAELTPALVLPTEDALELLRHGQISIEGRLMSASNATLYCAVSLDGVVAACVYKPVAGERPLWDFPDGTLAEREVAAYEVSAASGWDIVPATVYREDAPAGPGMLQLWVDSLVDDDAFDIYAFLRDRANVAMRRIAVFDAVINNTDRKGGHVLPVPDGHVYGIDHGVCFHVEDKLRTVLWQWAGETLPADALDVLARLHDAMHADLGGRLSCLLTRAELRAMTRRMERLLHVGMYPVPNGDWPAVPYPPI